ncbi:unnamed protein product [Allacma fusca]|uniref:C2H2-type domain-containing protein n=1 Tax=Allacma fusca TaxID=39272 RepID=A0A8J2PG41_9HEXA|nr:unnamed protein product [Allacma fusca]
MASTKGLKHSEKCANCAFEFTVQLREKRTNRSSLKKDPGARVSEFVTKDDNNYTTIQVTEALTEIYKLKWLHLDAKEKDEESKLKLHLCGKCSMVFSQLYELYLDFSRLRTAGSFLAKISDEIDKLIGDFSSLTEAAGICEQGSNTSESPANSSKEIGSKGEEVTENSTGSGGVGKANNNNNGIDVGEDTNHIEATSPPLVSDNFPRRSTRSSTRLVSNKSETECKSNSAPKAFSETGQGDQPSEPKKSRVSEEVSEMEILPSSSSSSENLVSSLPPPFNHYLRFEESVTSTPAATSSLSSCEDLSSASQLFSSNPNDPYHCPVCGKSFLSEFRLHCHRTYCRNPNEPISVVDSTKLKCDLCSFVFASKKSLIRHYQSMHYQVDPPSHSKCGVCGLNFPSMKEKDEHVLSHYRPGMLNGATGSSSNHYYHRDVISTMGTIAVGLVHSKAFRPFDGTHFLSRVDNSETDEDCLYLVPEVTLEEDDGEGHDFTIGMESMEDDEESD